MSIDLRKARGLASELHIGESVKLLTWQCSRLRVKVLETLDFAEEEEASSTHPARYSKVFGELYRVVCKVKAFIGNCKYKGENDFVLAAIKVAAHKERFFKYYVELDWCVFLIKLIRDAKGEPVASDQLGGFDWKHKVQSLTEETASMVEKDLSDFKDMLRRHVDKRGDHQKICATLLRRFKNEIDPEVYEVGLGVPPLENKGDRIGKGGYGKVYNFKWKKTIFAVKIPSFNSDTLDKEVDILEKCSHPNIVNLILFHKKPDGKQFLMMEKLSKNLLEYLKSIAPGSSVHVLEAIDMILQVSEGMEYLSDRHRVSHRDMKPENILVRLVGGDDGPMELQVADFGLAKVRAAIDKSSKHTPNVGTTRYRAPEMTCAPGLGEDRIHGQSLKADMFSFAVTCSCILSGVEPYQDILGKGGMEELRKHVMEGGRPSLPDDCPVGLTSLLKECWDPAPSKRPASFFEICERLRKEKGILLIGDAHKGDQPGPSSRVGDGVTFKSGVRPIRILVLGSSRAVEAICEWICGSSVHFMEGPILVKESVSTLPPLCLYRAAKKSTTDSTGLTDIMSFLEVRNKRWSQANLKAAWMKDLYDAPDDSSPFPRSSPRLHMVWYVCGKGDDPPNALQWEDITKKLYGLPIQMLATETSEYEKIKLYKGRFFDESQPVKNFIFKVDLQEAVAKEWLWRTCREVKSKAEIKNAALIIGYIREQLGPNGFVNPITVAFRTPKEFSVDRSKEFILNFLCTYWDVPRRFVDVLPGVSRPQEATKFVLFCLQNASAILYREHELVHGLVPDGVTTEIALREAQVCAEAYFKDLDFDACDKMKFADVQRFLEAVYEGRSVPTPLVSGLGRRQGILKFSFERLRGIGHGP